ncbi:hypothetical protein ScPMuIL_017537 [Solemya velum]
MTDLRTTRFYQAILSKNITDIRDECFKYIMSGKDINLKDISTGDNYIHLIAELPDKFSDAYGVTVIYMMCCRGIDLDHRNKKGQAPIHMVVRKHGAYRFMVALARCGADLLLKNLEGQTAEDILLSEKPEGWQEMLHWYNKFRPGLWRAMTAVEPDRMLVRRLLQSWCRPRMIKSGKLVNLKCIAQCNPHYIDLFNLMEEFENSIEFVLSLLAGKSTCIRTWMRDGLMENINVSIKDMSYQYRYPDYPDVPQPLLAAVWETGILECVDTLMDLGVDTQVLYSNRMPEDPPKPLFFQLICGKPKPDDKIIQRILAGSNMDARNQEGQTILYEAIAKDYPKAFIKKLFHYGLNVASRDRFGRTARDFADLHNKPTYVKMIDGHVVKLIEQCDIERIEALILQEYDHVTDICNKRGKFAMKIAKSKNSRQLMEVLQNAHVTQKNKETMFLAAEKGDLTTVSKFLTKKLCTSRDRCGRTIIHRSLLGPSRELIHYLVDGYRQLLNLQDSMGRTALHYSWLLMEGGGTAKYMEQKGANPELHDVVSRQGAEVYPGFGIRNSTVFCDQLETTLQTAITSGDIEGVSNLITRLRAMGDVNRYSGALFDCVDEGQEDIACFLVSSGMKTDIWKQYERCNPSDPECAMGECLHTMTSLKQQSKDRNRMKILSFIEELEKNSVKGSSGARGGDVREFTKYGLV